MSEENQVDNDPERTLVTLEQLSQTIEVMTSVVNRLRQHLSEQLQAKLAEQKRASEAALLEQAGNEAASEEQAATPDTTAAAPEAITKQQDSESANRESFVVEIRQQEPEPVRKNDKTLH